MIKTKITQLLGIEYPVIQGGMAWAADAQLAAAVSNGGGLGLIGAMNAGPEWLREQLALCRGLTDKPFGVNIMLMSPHADDVVKVCIEEKVKIITTGAGSPAKYMPELNKAGIMVIPVVASVALAKMAERYGACAVIAEGCEAGGHIGELTTLTLVPQVADAVSLPVIAAGGIADGRGFAAALMLGAEGVQCGTVFLSSKECNIHINYKNHIVKARDIDTVATGRRLGHPVRCLKTPFSRNMLQIEFSPDADIAELESMGSGALRLAAIMGDEQNGCFMCGQSAGLVKAILPAADIIKNITGQAKEILSGAEKWVK